MKKTFIALQILLLVSFFIPVLTSQAQVNQEFTFELKTTTANITSAMALINLPELLGNTKAIIVASPVGNTKSMNPHPTGAWYYSGKWYLFNSDFAPIPVGLTYKITYFLNAGPDQFIHLVTQQNLGGDGSYINHPRLNNNPNAQFAFFQNHAPTLRAGSALNAFEEKVGYSVASGKWYITNSGGQALKAGNAYNIVIPPLVAVLVTPTLIGGTVINTNTSTNPTNNSTTQPCNCPASLPPNGLAGGDLVGPYPDPMVRKILGRPLSNTAPTPGQVLKWNGTEWAGAEDNAGNNQVTANNIKTYYKYTQNLQGSMEVGGVETETKIPSISGLVITVNAPSTLVISASCYARANCPAVGSCPLNIEFYYKINNSSSPVHSFAGAEYLTAVISNHFYDVPAGTYTIDFYSRKRQLFSQLSYSAAGGYATVMVLPK